MSDNNRSAAIVQYEALEWVWILARRLDCPREFRDQVEGVLKGIADDGAFDFVAASGLGSRR